MSKFDTGYAIQAAAALSKITGKYVEPNSELAKGVGQELKARDIFNLKEFMSMNDMERREHLRTLEED